MNKTFNNSATETVAALTRAPTVFSSSVNTPTLNAATTYPAHLWSNSPRRMPVLYVNRKQLDRIYKI
jgi:hypothetical protein